MEDIVILFIAGLLFFMAFAINERNASTLLAGYNTMSPERRARFDIKGYLGLFRKFFVTMSISMVIIYWVLALAGYHHIKVMCSVLFMVLSLPYLIIRGNEFDSGNTTNKFLRYLPVLLLIGIAGFVGSMFYRGLSDNVLIVSTNSIEIKGMYGEVIDIDMISNINLVNVLPDISMRTNGFASGSYLKGTFLTAAGEHIKLFCKQGDGPYLVISTNETTYYWNSSGQSEEAIFKQIQKSRR